MSSTRAAKQGLRLASSEASQQYVCRLCRLRAARQFSTSAQTAAEKPLYARWRDTIVGSKESDAASKSREENTQRRLDAAAAREPGKLEKKQDKWGREYEVATLVDPSTNSQYVQARTWDGLETVGGVKWAKARADRGEPYIGFVPQKRADLSDEQWQTILHHITVEALVLQKAGREAEEICNGRTEDSKNWMHTKSVTLQPSVDGGVTVSFPQAELEEQVLKSISEDDADGEPQHSNALQLELEKVLIQSQKGSAVDQEVVTGWTEISLQDPTLKLAVLKRTMQLTGQRLPDPVVSDAETLADLYNAFKKKPEPKKLAHTPPMQKLNTELPNVSVHARRQTIVDRERKIGRWKVIEDELLARDLPVFGTRYVGAKANVRS